MPEEKYVEGCQSCEDFKKSLPQKTAVVYQGCVRVKGVVYDYVVVESAKKAAEKHFILTTTSHHVGAEMVEVRAALNAEATEVAAALLGENYRIINNSGPAASSMTHYHVHLISPCKGERLPRAIANVQKVIEELEAPEELKTALDKALLQQK